MEFQVASVSNIRVKSEYELTVTTYGNTHMLATRLIMMNGQKEFATFVTYLHRERVQNTYFATGGGYNDGK